VVRVFSVFLFILLFLFYMLPFLFFSCCLCRFSPNVIYKTKKLVFFF